MAGTSCICSRLHLLVLKLLTRFVECNFYTWLLMASTSSLFWAPPITAKITDLFCGIPSASCTWLSMAGIKSVLGSTHHYQNYWPVLWNTQCLLHVTANVWHQFFVLAWFHPSLPKLLTCFVEYPVLPAHDCQWLAPVLCSRTHHYQNYCFVKYPVPPAHDCQWLAPGLFQALPITTKITVL